MDLSYLVANLASVSNGPARTRVIALGYLVAMRLHQVQVGLFVECKDVDLADLVDEGWTVVQKGKDGALAVVAQPGVDLDYLDHRVITYAQVGYKWTGARVKVGDRGILSVRANGQRFNLGHAPLPWTHETDDFAAAMARMPGIGVGDLNTGRRAVVDTFPGRTVIGGERHGEHKPDVIYATVPEDIEVLNVEVLDKGYRPGADHHAYIVRVRGLDNSYLPVSSRPRRPRRPLTNAQRRRIRRRRRRAIRRARR